MRDERSPKFRKNSDSYRFDNRKYQTRKNYIEIPANGENRGGSFFGGGGTMRSVLWAVVAWAAASLILPPLIALAWRVGALDVPRDQRRMHRDSVPRIGGVAIFLVFVIAVLLSGLEREGVRYTLAGASIVFLVGLADDLFTLPAWIKFFFQLIAAAFAVGGEGTASGLGVFAAVFWVILLTNAHNLIDGMDGLFAGTAVIECIGLTVVLLLLGQSGRETLILGAVCLAFRAKNRFPARIFAGDCGSGTVGFLLGMFSLPAFAATWSFGILVPFLLFAYPIADLSAAVLRRLLRGRSIFAADRGHLHHRLYATGIGVVASGRVLLTASGTFVALSILFVKEEWQLIAAGACLCAIGILLLLRGYILRRADRENVPKKVDFPNEI